MEGLCKTPSDVEYIQSLLASQRVGTTILSTLVDDFPSLDSFISHQYKQQQSGPDAKYPTFTVPSDVIPSQYLYMDYELLPLTKGHFIDNYPLTLTSNTGAQVHSMVTHRASAAFAHIHVH